MRKFVFWVRVREREVYEGVFREMEGNLGSVVLWKLRELGRFLRSWRLFVLYGISIG